MIRTVAAFLVTLVVAGAWAMLSPGASIQPGQLLAGHASLHDDCLACHTVASGVEAAKCVKCHAVASIGLAQTNGTALVVPRPAVQRLHAPLVNVECAACHAEHAGRLGGGRAARFRHDALPTPLRDDCARCHEPQRPTDAVHRASAAACGTCHATDGWKPARFEHATLPQGTSCAPCHAANAPSDELHAQNANTPATDCGVCHTSNAWKPATFAHEKYFRFDRNHPPRCADCHEPGKGYATYSCESCHPMSKIAGEHREEGIQDFKDCVKCHRTGDEDDAKRGERRGRKSGGKHGEEEDDDR